MRCSCVIPAALFLLMSFALFCDYELWVKRPFDALFLCYSRCTVSTDEFCILLWLWIHWKSKYRIVKMETLLLFRISFFSWDMTPLSLHMRSRSIHSHLWRKEDGFVFSLSEIPRKICTLWCANCTNVTNGQECTTLVRKHSEERWEKVESQLKCAQKYVFSLSKSLSEEHTSPCGF